MSGIYIPGMEMPTSCLVCPCSGTDNPDDGNEVWVCEASKLRRLTTEDKIERRPEWCPLVEIPPHGDLVDRNGEKRTPSNNFELLKAMSIDQLAVWLAAMLGVNPFDGTGNDYKKWLNWLKQEAE